MAEVKRKLQKLDNKQFAEDIKRYIRSSHSFYESKVPELKTLAKRLHEEHKLKEFYKVFTKLWNSSAPSENSLAIQTLQLYRDEFNMNTWKFLRPKLNSIKSHDQADSIAVEIIGHILLKYPKMKKEMLTLSRSNNILLKRIAIMSTIPSIENKKIDLALEFSEKHLYDKEHYVNEAIGIILRRIGEKKPELIKRFILKHIDMPITTFNIATRKMKQLRKMRKIKKLTPNKFGRFFFWRA